MTTETLIITLRLGLWEQADNKLILNLIVLHLICTKYQGWVINENLFDDENVHQLI